MTDIIVYGRGKTGQSVKKMTQKLGINAFFYDDYKGMENGGKFSSDTLVVASPGVKPTSFGIERAKNDGAKIVGELDFCFPYCKGKCVSVTGTNGKTTTCELIHHILSSCKISSRLLGNGGVPFSEQVLDVDEKDVVVLESSSFQLNNAERFSPYISVVTNIAPDHLDYHGNFQNYIKAKRNNFCHQHCNSYAVFNADDKCAADISDASNAYTLYYSVDNEHANCYFKAPILHLNVGRQTVNFQCEFLETLPRHNLSNVLCAVLVCYLLGVDVADACKSVQTYEFLPHRLQTVAKFNGVAFIDDSKATNVHATVSALSCFENQPVALILGGSDKGCDFDGIFSAIKSNVKLVCAVGQTANKIFLTGLKYFVDVRQCTSYRQAVEECYNSVKQTGGVVLMSNACASFDEFDGYAQRGEYFARLVEELRRVEEKN